MGKEYLASHFQKMVRDGSSVESGRLTAARHSQMDTSKMANELRAIGVPVATLLDIMTSPGAAGQLELLLLSVQREVGDLAGHTARVVPANGAATVWVRDPAGCERLLSCPTALFNDNQLANVLDALRIQGVTIMTEDAENGND